MTPIALPDLLVFLTAALTLNLTPGKPVHAEIQASALKAWRDGVFVNLLNPKIIVFMFAFLPPFIRPENGAPLLQLFILGMLFNIGRTAINCVVAFFAGSIGEKLATSAKFARGLAISSSALFVVPAARLAFERR